MNIYKTSFFSKCPINGDMVKYSITICASWLIKAEDIEAACNFKNFFHEDIADELFGKFGGYQVIIATHRNVSIETQRGVM